MAAPFLPKSPRKLTAGDMEKFNAWVRTQTRTGLQPCSMCGALSWKLSEHVVEIRPFYEGNMVLSGPLYPMVVLTCGNCGHSVFFNAVLIGIVEGKKDGG